MPQGDTHKAQTGPETAPPPEAPARGSLFATEIVFLGFIGLVTLAAFFEALTYKIVSSRTPFVIMVPLFILIAVHAFRLWRVRDEFNPGRRIRAALRGENEHFRKLVGFSGWMAVLVVMILVLGHYAALFLFCVILMRGLAGETWKLSLIVAACTTAFIYGTFEILFNIDLYRGLIVRYFLGFRDF